MFKRILIAVDASDQSARAVDVVADLAERYGAEVIVEHICAERMTMVGVTHEPLGPVYQQGDESEWLDLVTRVAKRLRDGGVRAVKEVLTAPEGVSEQLQAVADRQMVDLVVVGSRGRSDLSALLFGSVSHDLIRKSECPVLLVP